MDISRISHHERNPQWGKHQYVGCEIEVERSHNHDMAYEHCIRHNWTVTTDGSLRDNGRELISPPLRVEALVAQLPHVYADMQRAGSGGSVRTGIHLHFDMLARTIEEVQAVCAAYSLVEPALYALLPSDRDQGIYCVPWYRAPAEARVLSELQRTYRSGGVAGARNLLVKKACKYSGLNIASLASLGTLEFRMAPTFGTAAEAQAWVQTVASVIEVGLSIGSPAKVLACAAKDGVASLLPSLQGLEALAEKYDSYYCAEILAGTTKSTWYKPKLEYEDNPTPANQTSVAAPDGWTLDEGATIDFDTAIIEDGPIGFRTVENSGIQAMMDAHITAQRRANPRRTNAWGFGEIQPVTATGRASGPQLRRAVRPREER